MAKKLTEEELSKVTGGVCVSSQTPDKENDGQILADADTAKKMLDYTQNSILQQAAQAMLAQANQQGQGIIEKLQ